MNNKNKLLTFSNNELMCGGSILNTNEIHSLKEFLSNEYRILNEVFLNWFVGLINMNNNPIIMSGDQLNHFINLLIITKKRLRLDIHNLEQEARKYLKNPNNIPIIPDINKPMFTITQVYLTIGGQKLKYNIVNSFYDIDQIDKLFTKQYKNYKLSYDEFEHYKRQIELVANTLIDDYLDKPYDYIEILKEGFSNRLIE